LEIISFNQPDEKVVTSMMKKIDSLNSIITDSSKKFDLIEKENSNIKSNLFNFQFLNFLKIEIFKKKFHSFETSKINETNNSPINKNTEFMVPKISIYVVKIIKKNKYDKNLLNLIVNEIETYYLNNDIESNENNDFKKVNDKKMEKKFIFFFQFLFYIKKILKYEIDTHKLLENMEYYHNLNDFIKNITKFIDYCFVYEVNKVILHFDQIHNLDKLFFTDNHMGSVVHILNEFKKEMVRYHVLDDVQVEFFNPIFNYLNSIVFNFLFKNNGLYCSLSSSLSLKMNINIFENWIREKFKFKNHLTDQFSLLKQSSDLMIMNKSQSDSIDLLNICPDLNHHQIITLMRYYHKDRYF
jgi:hypothetical protein